MREWILSKYKLLNQTLVLFGITVLLMSFIGKMVGEEAKEYSTLFALGAEGIRYRTLMELLGSSFIISILNQIFFSEKYFQKLMSVWRTVFLLCSIVVVMSGCIIVFRWFPATDIQGWIGFFLCFGGSSVISSFVMIFKAKLEERKYDRLLQVYKAKKEGGTNE